ncbi:hypothetical protein A2U01_0053821, partial [Trifolium medium]|nr:hypothetical protein [Trifolium medium]
MQSPQSLKDQPLDSSLCNISFGRNFFFLSVSTLVLTFHYHGQ